MAALPRVFVIRVGCLGEQANTVISWPGGWRELGDPGQPIPSSTPGRALGGGGTQENLHKTKVPDSNLPVVCEFIYKNNRSQEFN